MTATSEGLGPVVVFSAVVSQGGAPWMRLHFQHVFLSGAASSGNESFLRITSLGDGAVQVLRRDDLARWRNSSAYFNGDEVLVELLAYSGTGPNRITIDRLASGLQTESSSTSSICGADDRVPFTDPRTARFRLQEVGYNCSRETWGTAFLIDRCSNGLLTAGHVCKAVDFSCGLSSCDVNEEFAAIVEFNVPLSLADGTIQCANPEDQYPVDPASVQYQFDLAGDWCYFGVLDNTDTDLSPLEAQGDFFRLAKAVPDADGSTLRITGYGVDDDPVGCCDPPLFATCGFPACPIDQRNDQSGTQQTDSGPYVALDGTRLEYTIDTEGGNSGSAVLHVLEDLVYAIHTAGGCNLGPTNSGTAITHPDLLDALANPIGICADCNDNGVLDHDDITAGTSEDCDGNGVPDECQPDEDCNTNQVQDICDIAAGTSLDLNGNDIPDECEGPVGACCHLNATCAQQKESTCDAGGGTFQGNATTCTPSGACCMGDETCHDTIAACCSGAGGTFSGGTICGTSGACCASDGTCREVSQECCNQPGEAFDVGSFECILIGGANRACCLGDGSCTVLSAQCCAALGGAFQGGNHETCLGSEGACCPQPFGQCSVTYEDCCDAQGGLFTPGGTCPFLFPCAGTSGRSQGP